MSKTYHVIPSPKGGWSVKKSRAERATRRFDNQEKAISFARGIVANDDGVVVIHRRDGTVRDKLTVGPSD